MTEGMAEFTLVANSLPVLIAPNTVYKVFARCDGSTVICHSTPSGSWGWLVVREDFHVVQLRLNRADIYADARKFMERVRLVCLN